MPEETEQQNLDATTEDSSPSTTDATEESSTSKGEKTLSDVVMDTAKESSGAEAQETEDSPSEETEEETDQSGDKEESTADEESPEETEEEEKDGTEKEETAEDEDEESKDKALPFHDHPRWKQVLEERNTARQEAAALRGQAETVRLLNEYCDANNVTNEDFQNALRLAALSKKDAKTFRDELATMVETLDMSMGTKLPDDLQKKVDDGALEEADAKEIARARLERKQVESEREAAKRREASAASKAIADSLDAWEKDQRKSDPGYDVRRQELQERMAFLWAQKQPKTTVEAISLAEQANKDVKARRASLRPKLPTKKPLLSKGSSKSTKETLKLDSLEGNDLMRIAQHVAAGHRA